MLFRSHVYEQDKDSREISKYNENEENFERPQDTAVIEKRSSDY